ncbi:pentapeptide repeat-containing protein [Klugiella xanthotipulae]|uniref:Uncharacterized protein YjbI with pentapeptide repeats n=1 Tax=Klugiella xanthotipulae TaxID=244735 RepID=A0A543I6Q7_9MICO|nr:pentapeptide repeat-containing protein [Klugiella xanthotipulae]TQM66257.1 uncharacterized protein YjbI with pentapeptide repeats [Klugiella xanthotipulae]
MAHQLTHAPRIDSLTTPDLAEAELGSLRAHDTREGERYRGDDLSERDLSGVTFRECAFVEVTADDTTLRAATFLDTTLERFNAPTLRAPRSRLADVRVDTCRWGSAEFYDSSWNSVHISNCKIGYLNLRGAHLRDVLLSNCSVEELDLGGATATRVACVDTAVQTLDVTNATLEHVDLRGLDLRVIHGMSGLRGATLNGTQVAELATLLAQQAGIRIEE